MKLHGQLLSPMGISCCRGFLKTTSLNDKASDGGPMNACDGQALSGIIGLHYFGRERIKPCMAQGGLRFHGCV